MHNKPLTEETKKKISEKLKGRKSWNKGKKLSEEHRKKLSETKKKMAKEGKLKNIFTSENGMGREKTYFKKGSLHPNWQGGITPYPYKLRKTLAWGRWRKSVFERDNYTCQDCGIHSGNGKTIYLEPHHIIPLFKKPELAFDLNNGKTLCKGCHKKYLKGIKNE